jgi:hypothetical protein
VAGVIVNLRVTGRRGAPERPFRPEKTSMKEIIDEVVSSMRNNVIIEVRGLKPGDKVRSKVVISSIKKAVEEITGEKPVCIPPSAASGLISCSFKVYYENFSEFAGRLVSKIESYVYLNIDSLGYMDKIRVLRNFRRKIIVAMIAATSAVLLAVYLTLMFM